MRGGTQCGGGGYQEGLIGTLTEGGVVWTVHWGLTGKLGVELTHVFSGLLQRRDSKVQKERREGGGGRKGKGEGEGKQDKEEELQPMWG